MIQSPPQILTFPLNHPVCHFLVTDCVRHPTVRSALTECSQSSVILSLNLAPLNKSNWHMSWCPFPKEASNSEVCSSSFLLPCISSLWTFLSSLPINPLLLNMKYSIPFFLRYWRRLISVTRSVTVVSFLGVCTSTFLCDLSATNFFSNTRQLALSCLSVCLSVPV